MELNVDGLLNREIIKLACAPIKTRQGTCSPSAYTLVHKWGKGKEGWGVFMGANLIG